MPKDDTLWSTVLQSAAQFCAHVAAQITKSRGYVVQTLRIITNPFGEYLDVSSSAAAVAGIKKIEKILQGSRTNKPNPICVEKSIFSNHYHNKHHPESFIRLFHSINRWPMQQAATCPRHASVSHSAPHARPRS